MKREGTFCDKPMDNGPCPNQAIGACLLCENDVCAPHAAHPFGGLTLTIVAGSAVNPHHPDGDRNVTLRGTAERAICKDCLQRLKDNRAEEVKGPLAVGINAFAVAMRAHLAAKELKK